jgi:hypothetical protein
MANWRRRRIYCYRLLKCPRVHREVKINYANAPPCPCAKRAKYLQRLHAEKLPLSGGASLLLCGRAPLSWSGQCPRNAIYRNARIKMVFSFFASALMSTGLLKAAGILLAFWRN